MVGSISRLTFNAPFYNFVCCDQERLSYLWVLHSAGDDGEAETRAPPTAH